MARPGIKPRTYDLRSGALPTALHGRATSSNHSLHLYQVSRKYLEQFQGYGADPILISIITKEHNSMTTIHGVTVLVSAHRLIMVYICTRFRENILIETWFQSYEADAISILIITKGHNSVNTVYGATVLVLCTLSNHGLNVYQVLPEYLEWLQSYGADTILILIIAKEHNSVNIVCGVTVLVLCTLSNHGLPLYQVSLKYLEWF